MLWIVISGLALIGLIGALQAADYSLANRVALQISRATSLQLSRWLKVILTCGAAALIGSVLWRQRQHWRGVTRFLAMLGFAYTLLGAARIGIFLLRDPQTTPQSAPDAAVHRESVPRRVIWIIFDELDYGESLGAAAPWVMRTLPNLLKMQDRGASATRAFPPARDTQESVSALLMGTPPDGSVIDAVGGLHLNVKNARTRSFTQANTVFAQIPGGPAAGAILGYYHPYCRILPSVGLCKSYYFGDAGRWFDGLLFFGESLDALLRWLPGVTAAIPAFLLDLFDPMYRISDGEIRRLPEFLSQTDKSLVFIHLNVPHYPATYTQRVLALPPTAHDREAYEQNLLLTDRIVGEIASLLRPNPDQETLLILSSDHWHRINSLNKTRPIPFIAWHVGETRGERITQPISTVNTSKLILDFLGGTVTTQADIVQWWQTQPFYPTWIPHDYKY